MQGGDQLDLAHNFVFVKLPWSANAFRAAIDDFDALADAASWPAWFLANHDNPRVASRFDTDGQGPARARAVALMLYALRGTPFVFQGEELGLPDAEIPPDRIVDVDGRDPERAPDPVAATVAGRPRRRLHHGRAVAAAGGRRRASRRRAPGQPTLVPR